MEAFTLRQRMQTLMRLNGKTVEYLCPFPLDQEKLQRQIYGHSLITVRTLRLVLDRFPGVSAEWLVRGDGTMERQDIPVRQINNMVNGDNNGNIIFGKA